MKVSYLGNVYRSYCEPVTYVSHAGRDGAGSAFSRFPRGGSVLLSLTDRDVSIKQECCVKKVITVGVQ